MSDAPSLKRDSTMAVTAQVRKLEKRLLAALVIDEFRCESLKCGGRLLVKTIFPRGLRKRSMLPIIAPINVCVCVI